MNLTFDRIWQRLHRGKQAREAFVDSHLTKTIAFQIRALRGDKSQKELADMIGTGANAISRLESLDYGKPSISTLKRIAAALDVALIVRFVPFSQLARWAAGEHQTITGLAPETLHPASFERDTIAERKGPPTIHGAASEWAEQLARGNQPLRGLTIVARFTGQAGIGGLPMPPKKPPQMAEVGALPRAIDQLAGAAGAVLR